jgi:hypothetical protein
MQNKQGGVSMTAPAAQVEAVLALDAQWQLGGGKVSPDARRTHRIYHGAAVLT